MGGGISETHTGRNGDKIAYYFYEIMMTILTFHHYILNITE